MSLLKTTTLTVRRSADGTYQNGVWVEDPNPSSFSIECSLQPVQGEELETLLPAGRRAKSGYKIYTETAVETVDDQNPDIVEINGQDYEIVSSQPNQSGLIPHYKLLAIRNEPEVAGG